MGQAVQRAVAAREELGPARELDLQRLALAGRLDGSVAAGPGGWSAVRTYLFKRIAIAGLTLLGMSLVIFYLMRLAPGNITDIIFESAGYVDEADRHRLEAELGIDRPLIVQYGRWLGDFVQGDLGKSYRYDLPAWQVIKPRIPVTLELAVLAMGFAVLIGVPTGVVSAIRQDRPVDYALR